jgi:excisionase family DNA binding protein
MGFAKINIARRRLEQNGGQQVSENQSHTWRPEPLTLLHGGSSPAAATPPPAAGFCFHIPEDQALELEAMAESGQDGIQRLAASVVRDGPVLILRIESPAHARRLISSTEVAEMMGVSRPFVYHLAHESKLRVYRIGRMLRFDPKDVIEFLSACLDGRGS